MYTFSYALLSTPLPSPEVLRAHQNAEVEVEFKI
jgi:hypothetical protein